ncbi:MAG: hypothetical protein ACRECC_13950 [Pseudolabrys sp.]|jgi:pentapeptide MXKDX repeat protein
MKTVITLAAAAALLAGVSIANAQTTTANPELTKQNSGNTGKAGPGSMNKGSMNKDAMDKHPMKKRATTGSGMRPAGSMSPGSTPADKNAGPTGNESNSKIPDTKAK